MCRRLKAVSLRLCVVAVLALSAAACAQAAPTASPAVAPTATPVGSPSPSVASPTAAPTQAAYNCPVTVSNGSTPPGEAASKLNHGDGKLWTVLWPNETVLVPAANVDGNGVLWMKFPWWRGPGISGPLQIVGTRLDAKVAPLQADIPDGYGDIGFQATGIGFSTEGCWQVTGSVGSAKLTFVTRVMQSG
jgi:hypothetical protein